MKNPTFLKPGGGGARPAVYHRGKIPVVVSLQREGEKRVSTFIERATRRTVIATADMLGLTQTLADLDTTSGRIE